jgi:zinc transport system substrate-binding protein
LLFVFLRLGNVDKKKLFLAIVAMALVCVFIGCSDKPQGGNAKILRNIVTSDTILSGMIASLLPPSRYSIEAILPPGQCPGHYDVKLSDIEKMKKADLTVSFSGMPFMEKAGLGGRTQLLVDSGGRNWMAPDSYIYGLGVLADGLSKRFPEEKDEIMNRKEDTIRAVKAESISLIEKIKEAGIFGKSVITSSMQKEVLEWMGFHVLGEYGRQEAMSTREVVRLSEIGRDQKAIMVVDNLQSGPDAGKGIAETLGVPHVILTNFPSEKGYLATLGENMNAVLTASKNK